MIEHYETMRTLYICYFGLREPLVQTQVLPYLRQLGEGGIDVSLLTFEPDKRHSWSEEETIEWRDRLQAGGIRWFSLGYHKRPSLPATLYDIAVGAWKTRLLARRYNIDVLHARAHVPMAMALLARRWTGCRLVFDIRGLMAEEYADAGIWIAGGLKYRAIKWLERAGIKRADQVVVLTNRMRDRLIENEPANENKVEAIPCCVDLSRFPAEESPADGRVSKRFEVVYAGSVTGLYLLEEMGRFFLAVRRRRPDAYLRILTNSPAPETTRVLTEVGIDSTDFRVGLATPDQVPAYLCRASLGLSFRKPALSQIAASPTKIAEYLAAGLAVVSNAGVGDTDELLEMSNVGVVVRELDSEAYDEAAASALRLAADPDLRARCRAAVAQRFDLVRVGGPRYRSVYDRIQNRKVAVPDLAATL